MIRTELAAKPGPVVKLQVARRLPGLSPYFTAAYWVDGLLVDTGCHHTGSEIISVLKALEVDQVVNTHSHEDHIGGNASVQATFGCRIWAHRDALAILEDPSLQPLEAYRRILWGWPLPSGGEPVGECVETERFRFQCIHTPGHSPDHICLFEAEQGWLFSGDAYIGGRDRALRKGYDIHGIIASLKVLARLPVKTIFSGSGSVREEGCQALQAKIAYLEELGARIRLLHDQGHAVRRIRRQILGRELSIAYLTLGHFSGTHLVRSYIDGFAQRDSST